MPKFIYLYLKKFGLKRYKEKFLDFLKDHCL
ncbi:hypothetical protein CHY_2637 [Carboxydothermus hydrogenoformans Z-2901]|uniref:Uncharacterized protein n=1 Tax=Carboxydothermus hydrogenoformans (strain ATCC BAA-161 / DSM 6008 / Z-2901) TaxID=246194 RepID=Q3A8V5_CARHZ|nr:hypothetical protein CHY_2637 [Carboxydothermus hydrogenoformans Z-2901]